MSTAAPRRPVLPGAVAAVLLLLLAAPSPAQSLRTLRDAASATDQAAPLVALLALLAWTLAAWLLLVVAATAGGHLPGVAGRALAAVARRVAPGTVRRTVEVALGLTVAVGTLAASPALAAPGPGTGSTAPTGISLDRAAPAPAPGLDGSAPTPVPAPDLDWAAPASGVGETVPPAQEAPAAKDRGEAARAASTLAADPLDAAGPVVVQPGDSLWALAEQDLAARGESTTDAAVAQAWPTWWAANREVVGEDPDLLHPGMRLAPPADVNGGAAPPSGSTTAAPPSSSTTAAPPSGDTPASS